MGLIGSQLKSLFPVTLRNSYVVNQTSVCPLTGIKPYDYPLYPMVGGLKAVLMADLRRYLWRTLGDIGRVFSGERDQSFTTRRKGIRRRIASVLFKVRLTLSGGVYVPPTETIPLTPSELQALCVTYLSCPQLIPNESLLFSLSSVSSKEFWK